MAQKSDCSKNLQIENRSSSCQRWSLHGFQVSNIAFHLRPIWLQTLVAIDSESRLTSFPSFCAPPSEVAALFDSNLSRRCAVRFESEQTSFPRAGRRFRSAALHRIRFGTCCFVLMSYFYSETNLIERLSEAMDAALVGNNFSTI